MCGIAGFLRLGEVSFDMHLFGQAMAERLAHRGPNSQGTWVDEHNRIVIAHRRLSIQDVSTNGSQPMHSHRYAIVFNGEIYNFRSLSKTLASLGYSFRGHSDTEVLLAALEAWGIEKAIQQLNGMFAFALWDKKERKLLLARDRLGEKPLYYGWVNKGFIFGSELKSLTVHPRWIGEVNKTSLTLYLRYGYVPTPHSIYTGVYKLPPGCTLVVSESSSPNSHAPWPDTAALSPKPYWSLRFPSPSEIDPTDATNELERLLTDSVCRQMVSDVPLGAFLSGGIDSTSVVAIMQSVTSSPVRTFTIGFEELEYDESVAARGIADYLRTDHTTLLVRASDALATIPRLPGVYDEPFADPSQIPALLVSELAKRSVTVALSGDGGDELFGGYNRYLHAESMWRKASRLPHPIRKLTSSLLRLVPTAGWDNLISPLQSRFRSLNTIGPYPGLKLQKIAYLLDASDLTEVYDRLISYWPDSSMLLSQDTSADRIEQRNRIFADGDFMNRAMFYDLLTYLPDDNLTKIDRASMAVGLETRLPLLDHQIVEFSQRLPVMLKIRGRQTKWLLREVLYRHVPRSLVDRPKKGFSVPIGQWLRGPLRDWGETLLDDQLLEEQHWFNVRVVRAKWHEHQIGLRDWSLALWSVLMFQSWLQHQSTILNNKGQSSLPLVPASSLAG